MSILLSVWECHNSGVGAVAAIAALAATLFAILIIHK